MASRKRFSVKEVIELVCMPDGALSDAESGPDDDDNDPDFDETQARDVDDESDDASLDDEDLELIARDAPTLLNVQVHKVPQHADTVSDDESDTEPRPGPARLNRQQFTWIHRKPHTADVDATYPYFLLHLMTYRVQSGILTNSWTDLSLSGSLNNLICMHS